MDQRLPEPAVAAPPDWRGQAQPKPEVVGPSDEELLSIAADCFAPVMVHFARAVLARWGRPAPAPAGEVGELVARLRYAKQNGNNIPSKVHWDLAGGTTHYASIYVGSDHADDCALAADLLQRQAAPVPVAVSDRLPQPEDCDAEGRCWWWYPEVPEQTYGYWLFEDDATDRAQAEWPSAWLPAHALPLPSGEVEA